ncbi:hypothetical protein [Pseudarthrobacter sp. N5]|uniref:hypothetical protein n=1 Tax=Pseudarthrobacter sp. N5 TaxID=3418416 RepID=UPI003CF56613
MKRTTRRAAALAALTLLCIACTDGGWLDQTRLSFFAEGIDSTLASEERNNSSISEMVSRGDEVLAILDISTRNSGGRHASYSSDGGES